MSNPLHQKLLKCIGDRSIWEQRQRIWYQMRHDGLRRRNKPFPGASDLHFPLVDTMIEKLKPFYFQQVFSQERLAMFVSRSDQQSATTESVAEFFDYTMKQETNFEDEVLSLIDTMLLTGRGILKQLWDPYEQRLRFESIHPLYMIVPRSANTLEEADYFAHVKHISAETYKRDPRYTQDEELIKRIKGRRDRDVDSGNYEFEKSAREGLTHSQDDDVIVLWEAYQKTRNGWTVHTFSPQAPGVPLRKPFGLPLKWQGRSTLPFACFSMEVKEKGWYSPRGVAERMAPFEASCTKQWNEKHDMMSFFTKPLFRRGNESPNTANVRFGPGEVLPIGVEPAPMPPVPPTFDEEMLKTRAIAEENLMIPDFAANGRMGAQQGARTATEVDYIRTLSGTGVDLKGRVFRKGLCASFKVSWAFLLRHQQRELSYFVSKELKQLPREALHDQYLVAPDGSPDQWNKAQRIQRAVGRFQLLAGNPNVNQEELVKDLLASDDSRLVQKLFLSAGIQTANEAEDEAIEVLLLMNGYPAQATPSENHALRLEILVGKIEQIFTTGGAIDDVAQQRFREHISQHLIFLAKQNPALAKSLGQQIENKVKAMTEARAQQLAQQQAAARAAAEDEEIDTLADQIASRAVAGNPAAPQDEFEDEGYDAEEEYDDSQEPAYEEEEEIGAE